MIYLKKILYSNKINIFTKHRILLDYSYTLINEFNEQKRNKQTKECI